MKFKFRAFNKINNEIYMVYGWNISKNEIYVCSLPNSAFKGDVLHTMHVLTKNLDNYILMQYTGLKDINGVEIYEGDILKVTGCGIKTIDYVVSRLNGMNSFSEIFGSGDYEIEVIGNIYENTELLEEEE